ncbi:MAG TPA: glycosyltransferase family 2 protein [Burkholderiaceae bacterium]|nr:glycosyltransferase family 2 protein [Burkholderiaceae bacterium]
MPEFELTTPIAFIIFNRPDTTERVFAEIAKARPTKLLLIGDGPRATRPGEAEKVAAARRIVEKVNWPCDVRTNFSDVNLGCTRRVASGLDWVFQQFEDAIIMEDDCLPDPTFFRFCQELLERYRHDLRIGMISGNNFQFGRRYGEDSYYFSKYCHIWGWATWRDRWQSADILEMRHWPMVRDSGRFIDLTPGNKKETLFWQQAFDKVHQRKLDAWAGPWTLANWIEGRLGIIPAVNLISNIGFGADATLTTDGESYLASMRTEPIAFPLVHPVIIARHIVADRFGGRQFKTVPAWRTAGGKVKRKLKRILGLSRGR